MGYMYINEFGKASKEHIIVVSIITSLLNVSRIYYVIFNLKEIVLFGISFLISFIMDLIISNIFINDNIASRFYIFCHLIVYVFSIAICYYNEIKEKTMFFMNQQFFTYLKQIKRHLYNVKNPYFTYSIETEEIKSINKSYINLINYFNQYICEDKDLTEYDVPTANLMMLRKERKELKRESLEKVSIFNIFKENSFQIEQYVEECDEDSTEVERIFSNFIEINDNLPVQIKEYMNLVKYDNKQKVKFNLKMFSSFLKKTRDSILEHNDKSNSLSISFNTVENTYNRLLSITRPQKTIKKNLKRSNSKDTITEYTFLGKIRVRVSKSSNLVTKQNDMFYKDYYVYFNVINELIYFIIEDNNTLILKERKDTVHTCRKLYMSKIAHEIKNPICNMLEVLQSIDDKSDTHINNNESIQILKNICQLLSQMTKDFSFYSKEANDGENYENLTNYEKLIKQMTSTTNTFRIIDVIDDIVLLFTDKAKIDNKKCYITIEIKSDVPPIIECDKQLFISLLFNLVFHNYKSMLSGNIKIEVAKCENTILFSVIGKGVINNMIKKTIVKKFTCKDVEVNNNVNYAEDFEDNDEIEKSDLMESNIAENFHIQNIIMIVDVDQRNNVIDEFNNNFHLYISQLYCKKLGKNLKIESSKHLMITSFSMDSLLFFKEEKRSETMMTLSQTMNRNRTISNDKAGTYKSGLLESCSEASEESNESEFFQAPTIRKDFELCIPKDGNIYINNVKQFNITANNIPMLNIQVCEKPSRKNVRFNTVKHNNNIPSIQNFENKINMIFPITPCFKGMDKPIRGQNSARMLSQSESKLNDLAPDLRVLLVDDEILIRKSLTRYFNKIGDEKKIFIDIREAENGFESLCVIYNYYVEGKKFDIVIIDETMPLIKGSMVIELLKNCIRDQSMENIFIMSYTSYDSSDKKEYILSKGADMIVTKPINFKDFSEIIMNLMEKKT
jgi:CheY-like chemotaxis protein